MEPQDINQHEQQELRQAVTAEDLKAIIAGQQIPNTSRRHFKGENIENFKRILNSDTLLELDLLDMNGELNDEDMLEYFTCLPEYQEKVRELHRVKRQMLDFIRGLIPAKIKAVFGNNNYFNIYPLQELLQECKKLVDSFLIREYSCYFRRQFLGKMEAQLISLLVLEIMNQTTKIAGQLPQNHAMVINRFLENANQVFMKHYGVDIPSIRFYNFMPIIRVGTSRYRQGFNDVLERVEENGSASPAAPAAAAVPAEEAQLQREAEVKFKLITELEALVHLDRADKKYGNGRVSVIGMYDHIEALSRANTLYQFRVNINPDNREQYQVRKSDVNVGGQKKTTNYNITHDYFEGLIDRATGEVCMTSGLPYFLEFKPLEYLKLKHALYDAILEALAQKEHELLQAEVSSPASAPPGITSSLVTPVQETIEDEITQQLPEGTFEAREKRPAFRYDNQPESSSPQEPAPAERSPEAVYELSSGPGDNSLEYRRRLRSLKGKTVLRVLKSFLKELRCTGSHRIFLCRNGSTYPIAIHGEQEVGIGMLLKCLSRFGLSAREFCEAI